MYKNKMKAICFFCILFIAVTQISACSRANIKTSERTVKSGVKLEEDNVGGLKESQLVEKLKSYEIRINTPSKNARLNMKNWTVAETESTGRRLNVQKTLKDLLNSNEGDRIQLVVEEIRPDIKADNLKKNITQLASYSTPIIDRQTSRVKNIELAANKLNNKILLSSEEFSFNKAVGRRTESKGFEEAPIIVKTDQGAKKGYGVGGGVCQVASTLYNAAQKCGMEITERYMHSKDVGYVPEGKDATVSYGKVDFKFKNNRPYPIMIKTYMDRDSLTIDIIENRNSE